MPKLKRLRQPLVVSLLGATGVWAALRAYGIAVAWWQLWLLALAVGALLFIALGLRPGDDAAPPPEAAPSDLHDRPFADIHRWEDRLSWGNRDTERFRRTVQRRVVAVIAERLHARHGVDLATHPERATALLPPDLARLVAEPVAAPPSAPELDRIIRRIEEI